MKRQNMGGGDRLHKRKITGKRKKTTKKPKTKPNQPKVMSFPAIPFFQKKKTGNQTVNRAVFSSEKCNGQLLV